MPFFFKYFRHKRLFLTDFLTKIHFLITDLAEMSPSVSFYVTLFIFPELLENMPFLSDFEHKYHFD